jgi:hypothetical protein
VRRDGQTGGHEEANSRLPQITIHALILRGNNLAKASQLLRTLLRDVIIIIIIIILAIIIITKPIITLL